MSRITIIEGNTNEKDNVRTFFGKAEKGNDGVSPIVNVTRSNKIVTISVVDAEGEKSASVQDGFDPIVRTSKTGKVATVEIEDAIGTHSFDINDGETYEVPTNSVIGWESDDAIPNGYEEVDGPNDYSLEEKVIGKWVDGKPLYQKTIYISSLEAGDYPHGISDIEYITDIIGIQKNLYSNIWVPLWHYADQSFRIVVNRTNISIAGSLSSQMAYITLRYTKTTD